MYKLPNTRLISIDKKINELINDMILTKNQYKGVYLIEYSRTLHSLDLLQYTILDTRFDIDSFINEIKITKENFEIAKQIMDEQTKNDIQYCIDIIESHILSRKLVM